MNPYTDLPDSAFWRRSVAAPPLEEVDPVTQPPFVIARGDRVATAGSCFAQHISRELQASGHTVLIEEGAPEDPQDRAMARAFSAAFGNVYTARQLVQLFDRAYGVFHPADVAWIRPDGRFVDPFRPTIRVAGFASAQEVAAAREAHFDAVRRVFETCDVFVFTLGLTEAWASRIDGAVVPLAPGVEAEPTDAAWGDSYAFQNATVEDVVADLERFLDLLRMVNPTVRVVFTVSPVPLIATYAGRHVLVSTVASKAILRVAADVICARVPGVAYFPSYEIITGPQARGRFFEDDLRTVTAVGVAQVMRVFSRHYLSATPQESRGASSPAATKLSAESLQAGLRDMEALTSVICDEEKLDRKGA